MKKKTWIYLSVILTFSIFILFFFIETNMHIGNIKENLVTNNEVIGGTIDTIMNYLKDLNEKINKILNNIENKYDANLLLVSLKTPISLLYHSILNILPPANAIIESDILIGTIDTNSSSNTNSNLIQNRNIKEDPKWIIFVDTLNDLQSNFTQFNKYKNEYLANVPIPLPDNYDSAIIEIIDILKNLENVMNVINKYISNLLNS
jgi:predicted PurR-regulated permease PerM